MLLTRISRVLAVALLTTAISPNAVACNGRSASEDDTSGSAQTTYESIGSGSLVTPDTSPVSSMAMEPVEGTYNATSEAVITLGTTHAVSGAGASVSDGVVTVTSPGTYLITGRTANGQIVVDTPDDERVTLVLNGAAISCPTGPAILVRNAPKRVVIYSAEKSINILSDGTDYVVPDEEQAEGEIYPNACVYACEDLTFDGLGEIYISGNADKGVNTKDDLEILGGSLVISSLGVGMRGNDSVTVKGGTVHVTSGADGIKSANTEVTGKGSVTVSDGTLYITSTGDGISAATDMTVSGGTLVITTKDIDGTTNTVSDSSSATGTAERRPGGMGGGMMPPGGGMGGMGGGMDNGNMEKSSISAKGLKAAGTLTVSGGKQTITSADDGVHSNDTVNILDCTLYISAADDGIHADNALTVSGGTIEIADSYEGLEAIHITVSGGTSHIHATDDGMNANGGTSMGGWGGHFGSAPEENTEGSTETPLLSVTGGFTVVYADGDGIDSNGNIHMTGGTLLVYGPTNNGNGAIDYGDGSYSMTVSGGTFLAVGSSGMAETAQNDGQAVFGVRGFSVIAGDYIGLLDADGSVVAAFCVPKVIQSIVYSSPALVAGDSYTVVTGGSGKADINGIVDAATYNGYTELYTTEAY